MLLPCAYLYLGTKKQVLTYLKVLLGFFVQALKKLPRIITSIREYVSCKGIVCLPRHMPMLIFPGKKTKQKRKNESRMNRHNGSAKHGRGCHGDCRTLPAPKMCLNTFQSVLTAMMGT